MNKAFTLLELLVVIIIIGLMGLITITSITKVLNNSKNKLYNVQISSILSATKNWGGENINLLPNDETCIYLTLMDLKNYGNLDSNILDSRNNEKISDDLKIKIEGIKNEYGKIVINYEVDSNDISDCTHIYDDTYYSNGSIIYYDVLKGDGCTSSDYEKSLLDNVYLNSVNGYNGVINADLNYDVGKQNSCLKFYAFNDKEDVTSLNLILDHNTTNYVQWDETTTDGPKKLLSQLIGDTSSWNGTINDLYYSLAQIDGTGYDIDYTKYTSRLITANEVSNILNNNVFDEIKTGGDTILNLNNNSWLINNNVDCYWTTTKVVNSNSTAWAIGSNSLKPISIDSSCGVRPVIKISKSKIK